MTPETWSGLLNVGMAGAVMLYTLYLARGFQQFLKDEAVRRDGQRVAESERRDRERADREKDHREFLTQVLMLHRDGLGRVAEEVKASTNALGSLTTLMQHHDIAEREVSSRLFALLRLTNPEQTRPPSGD